MAEHKEDFEAIRQIHTVLTLHFIEEMKHIDASLNPGAPVSPLDLDYGLDTMMVVAAAHRSHAEGRRMVLPTPPNYSLDALQFA